MLASKFYPPEAATSEAQATTAATIDPSTDNSWSAWSSPRSAWSSIQALHAPQIPNCTDGELDSTQQHEKNFGATFNSRWSTKSKTTMWWTWKETEWLRKNYETYRNFVKGSSYFCADSPGSQNELRPQFLDKFVAVSHLQNLHQARQFDKYWQLWVQNTSPISAHVFNKGMLTVWNQNGTSFYYFFILPFCRSNSSSLKWLP